jgi:hemoglobin
MSESLYVRIGGDEAVRAVVNRMYDKILSDSDLAPFFENVNVNALRLSQTSFVIVAFGGIGATHSDKYMSATGKKTANYTGQSLRNAHAGAVARGLSDKHFDLVASYLKESMQEMNVPDDLIGEAMTIVGSTRADVLNK